MAQSDRIQTQLMDLKSKNNKVKFLLGGLIYDLYKSSSIRFLYSMENPEEQKAFKKILTVLDDVQERIARIRQSSLEKENVLTKNRSLLETADSLQEVFNESSRIPETPAPQAVVVEPEELGMELSESIKVEQEKISALDPKDRFLSDLKNPDSSVRATAIKELGNLLGEDSVSVMSPMLDDLDPHVRGMAVTCLGIHGGKKGLRAIEKIKKDSDPYVKKCLDDLLGIIPPVPANAEAPQGAPLKTKKDKIKIKTLKTPKSPKISEKPEGKKKSRSKRDHDKKS